MKSIFFLSFAIFYSSIAFSASLTEQAHNEISHLLSQIEKSGCEFQRNGTWHSGPEARKHLQRKYDYLKEKALIKTAEDFISMGASQSSMSGKPYQVRCAGKGSQTSAQWLQNELHRFRKAPDQ